MKTLMKLRLSIRVLLIVTGVVAVSMLGVMLTLHNDPRPYKELEELTEAYGLRGWSVEVAPDLVGPYRTAGDDRSGAFGIEFNPGKPVRGWVEAGGVRRLVNHPGRDGVSLVMVGLETIDDRPTYLILSSE